ncbi:MAG: hypothetical protein KG003_13800 [Bacteroidetes bacterium]|nr:hypothetical protein [Bacteroidota bacterium]
MAYVPDVCYTDAKFELVSEKGQIKHAALTLYGYYCKCRNRNSGFAFPKGKTIVNDTGIPKSNVSMLRDFLEECGWIEVYPTGVIRPLKGFISDKEILKMRLKRLLTSLPFVLIIRTLVLKNRTFVLIIRTLFKGNLNQPFKPAHLTSYSAEPADAIPAEKHFEIDFSKIGVSPERAETTPKKINPKNGLSPDCAETKPDNRREHPAVKMVREISGRFPHKDQWDQLIKEIGKNPDIEFFRSCWTIWRSFDGKPTNLQGWVFIPNKTGKLPQVFSENPVQLTGKPPEKDWQNAGRYEEPGEIDRNEALEFLLELQAEGEDLSPYQKFYPEEDWTWLIQELNKQTAAN